MWQRHEAHIYKEHANRKDGLHSFNQEVDTDRIEAELASCILAHVNQDWLQT